MTICPLDEAISEVVVSADNTTDLVKKIPELLGLIESGNYEIVNRDSYSFFDEPDKFSAVEIAKINEMLGAENADSLESILEFEMFNVKRRDLMNFKEFMKCAQDCSKTEQTGKNTGKRQFQQGLFRKIEVHPHFKDALPYIPTEMKNDQGVSE